LFLKSKGKWVDSGKIPTLGIRSEVRKKGAEETGGVGAAEAGIQRTDA
jgi:hypothetical protein